MADSLRLRLGNFQGPLAPGGPTSVNINGSGIGLAWIIEPRTTDAITKLRFRFGSRSGTPPTYSICIEGVDASGNPDGVDKGGGSPTATTFTPPASTAWDGLTQEITLTNPYAPASPSERLAITIRYSSGTIDGSNNGSFTAFFSNVVAGTRGFPYHSTLSGGTWTKQTVIGIPNVAWVTATRTRGMVVQSAFSTTTSTIGNRIAAFVTLPSGWAQTTTVTGIHALFQVPATCTIGIWDASNTLVASRTITSAVTTGLGTFRAMLYELDAPVVLANGAKYYIGIEAGATATTGMLGIAFAASSDMHGLPNGDNVGMATYNGTTWTDVATAYALFELVTSDITQPTASGGAIVIGS